MRPTTPYDCFRIFEASYGLDRSAARRSILARDLRECEEECEREPKFTCSTLSFTSGTFTTNCHLTDALSTSLTRGRDFVRDYTSDVYERRDTAACRASNGQGSWDDGFQSHAYVRCSNFELPGERLARSTSRAIVAARDVADCEDQCLRQNRLIFHVFLGLTFSPLLKVHMSRLCFPLLWLFHSHRIHVKQLRDVRPRAESGNLFLFFLEW